MRVPRGLDRRRAYVPPDIERYINKIYDSDALHACSLQKSICQKKANVNALRANFA